MGGIVSGSGTPAALDGDCTNHVVHIKKPEQNQADLPVQPIRSHSREEDYHVAVQSYRMTTHTIRNVGREDRQVPVHGRANETFNMSTIVLTTGMTHVACCLDRNSTSDVGAISFLHV